MAIYESVNGVARKVVKMYDGVLSDVPIYGIEQEDVSVNSSTVFNTYFTRKDDDYYFGGWYQLSATNLGVDNSTAKTTLTAKEDMEVSFNYEYTTEERYDKFTLIVGDVTVEDGASGTSYTKSYSGTLLKGQSIILQYAKDSSKSVDSERCSVWSIKLKVNKKVQVGTEQATVARAVTKAYDSVNGVARVYFSTGTKWRKWSCSQSKTYSDGGSIYGTDSWSLGFWHGSVSCYKSYGWGGSYTGYTTTGSYNTLICSAITTLEEAKSALVGTYYISESDNIQTVYKIVGVNSVSPESDITYFSLNLEYVARANKSTSYTKGSIMYNEITAPAGELPEAGTLISGSVNGNYCVVKVGSTNYYYERV